MGVVGDDTEARVGRVFFHDPSKGHLCGRCHGVGFIEHDQLVRRQGARSIGRSGRTEDLLRA